MADTTTPTPNEDSARGLAFALGAYALWGTLPVYMKALDHVPVLEVLAHRTIWSVPVALATLIMLGRTSDLRTALRTPRMLGMAVVTSLLLSSNWGIYVWSVTSGQALETALGYFINPLFSVFLGRVLLGEHLNRLQWAAIALAALAVGVLTLEAGRLPLAALGLMLTWASYAYFKKMLPIGPNQGFALEVLLLLPAGIGYAVWLGVTGQGTFMVGVPMDNLLLVGCGVITAVPLIFYANGAKLLRLSTIGILQYLAPTLIFLTAVFIFDEPFEGAKVVAFPMIWAALVLYSLAMLRGRRGR